MLASASHAFDLAPGFAAFAVISTLIALALVGFLVWAFFPRRLIPSFKRPVSTPATARTVAYRK